MHHHSFTYLCITELVFILIQVIFPTLMIYSPDDYKLFLWKYDPLIVAKGVLNENEEIYYGGLKKFGAWR